MAKEVDVPDNRITLRRLLKRPRYRYMAVNRIVPHIPWLVLIFMATSFYKARIFAESGLYAFEFINRQSVWIECQRALGVIPEILPLIGVWLGVEIKYVLLLYSLSHVLFVYFLFLLVYYGFRDRRSGLLIILSQSVGIAAGFFSPIFGLYSGIPLLITFYAIWRQPFRYRAIYAIVLIEILILLSYPVAFMLFAYLLIYDYTRKTAKPFKFYLPVILIFAATAVFKYFMICGSELQNLDSLIRYSSNHQFIDLINPVNYKALGLFMLLSYPEVLLALTLVIFMLVKSKLWFRLLWVTASFLGYLFVANSFQITDPSYHAEHVMLPLVMLVFIPLIYGFPTVRNTGLLNISILLVSALIVYQLVIMYTGSEKFAKRVAQMEQLIEASRKKGGNKFMVPRQIVDHGYTLLNWSYPIETMLLSAFDGNDISTSIAADDHPVFRENDKIQANQFILSKKDLKDYNWLNARYFHLDIGPYRPLNDTAANKNLNITANNLRITINSKNIYKAMDTVWVPIAILNQGNTAIYSGIRNKVFLSYFWVVNNNVLNWNEIRTPLQSDIKGIMQQDIKVAVPRNKGRMQLKVDIIAEDNWLGIFSQTDVLVY